MNKIERAIEVIANLAGAYIFNKYFLEFELGSAANAIRYAKEIATVSEIRDALEDGMDWLVELEEGHIFAIANAIRGETFLDKFFAYWENEGNKVNGYEIVPNSLQDVAELLKKIMGDCEGETFEP